MTASLGDLRSALERSSCYFGPDPEVTLRRVEQRVAAADRRRRGVVLGLVAALVASGGALVLSDQRAGRDGTLQPGQTRSIPDHPSLPRSVPGLVRISLTEWNTLPDQLITMALPHTETDLVIRARCSDGVLDQRTLHVRTRSAGGPPALLPCPGPADAPRPEEPQLEALHLRPSDARAPRELTLEVLGNDTIGTARIAVYARTGVPARPATVDTDLRTMFPVYAAPVVFPGAPNRPVTLTGRHEPNLLISLMVRGPGTLRVTANGRQVSLQCHSDPDDLVGCRDEPYPPPFATVEVTEFGAAAEIYWGPDPGVGPQVAVGEPLTITITPSGFVGDDWTVQVFRWTAQSGDYPPEGTWTRR